ncbi:MAG: preprotein translocase subunit SecE [Candidatus Omnitrophota bacterium]|nr:preprotein translocase subunit SecE [Candidatus Omnitrophota bacterium]
MDFLINNFGKIIFGIVIAGSLILVVKNFTRIKKFVLEVKSELRKVSWSTRQELLSATLMVLVITGLLTVFVGIVDFGFSRALGLVIR